MNAATNTNRNYNYNKSQYYPSTFLATSIYTNNVAGNNNTDTVSSSAIHVPQPDLVLTLQILEYNKICRNFNGAINGTNGTINGTV